jgi:hypothetical protein
VTGNYYAILGVSPTSEDAVIRAAYRALIRRHHPDADPSGDAPERARAINAAYAVLGDPEKRARYDGFLAAQELIKPDPQPRSLRAVSLPQAGLVAIGALALLAAVLAVLAPPRQLGPGARPGIVAVRGGAPAVPRPNTSTAPDENSTCRTQAAQGLVKKALFDRAARLRGGYSAAFGRISDRAVVRVDLAETIPAEGALGCAGWVALDLPSGVVLEDGRSNLNAQIGYSLARGGKGGMRLVSLSGADELIRSLARAGSASEQDDTAEAVPANTGLMTPEKEASPEAGSAPAEESIQPRRSRPASVEVARIEAGTPRALSSSRTAGGCSGAALCASRNLAALDRQLASFTRQSLALADEAKTAALLGSGKRFQSRLHRCRSEACLTKAYVDQMRAVSEIMAGRRPQQ